MGFGLLGPIKLMSCSHDTKYILVVIDYVMKRVEVNALRINMVVIVSQLIYKIILIGFGCPFILVSNQGIHFINEAIELLTIHFLF